MIETALAMKLRKIERSIRRAARYRMPPNIDDANTLAEILADAPRVPRPGIRVFECTLCRARWQEPCRDHESPSGVDCPHCGEFCRPVHSEPADLPVDELGNLL